MNKWDARVFMGLMLVTLVSTLCSDTHAIVGFGFMSLAWATIVQKR